MEIEDRERSARYYANAQQHVEVCQNPAYRPALMSVFSPEHGIWCPTRGNAEGDALNGSPGRYKPCSHRGGQGFSLSENSPSR
jgi:hypothetical protein